MSAASTLITSILEAPPKMIIHINRDKRRSPKNKRKKKRKKNKKREKYSPSFIPGGMLRGYRWASIPVTTRFKLKRAAA